MIPPFDASTGYLPPGEHMAGWDEVVGRYGATEWRRCLLAGLQRALRVLQAAGCRKVYLDGSFVTAKEHPGDFDGCWEAEGVDFDALEAIDDTLLTFADGRAAQKAKFLGELFVAEGRADPLGTLFREFFKRDRDGLPKGIIVIDLKDLP